MFVFVFVFVFETNNELFTCCRCARGEFNSPLLLETMTMTIFF